MIKIGKWEIEKAGVRKKTEKWCCWNSAAFAKFATLAYEAKRTTGRYVEGAEKRFAETAMKYFEELWKLDPECAKMVGRSWSVEIAEMMETLGDDGKKYLKVLAF